MKRKLPGISNVSPKIRPVSKLSISDEIVDQIMTLIALGDLTPGQRLPSERKLCILFGAGRSSLREALRCLSIVGVLNARVGEGTSVAADGGKFLGKIFEWRVISERHDIENLMEVRIGLESMAAASAARSRTAEDMQSIDALLLKMKSSREDNKRFAALDVEFHLSVARASGNPLLLDMISMIRGQLVRGLSRVLSTPNAMPLSLKEHRRIVEAIRANDPDTASEEMSHHLKSSLARYRSFHKGVTISDASKTPAVKRAVGRSKNATPVSKGTARKR
jgi:GntR family transcriptional regulator, transcriptional repressor for pyruvate dehydrogenase complex